MAEKRRVSNPERNTFGGRIGSPDPNPGGKDVTYMVVDKAENIPFRENVSALFDELESLLVRKHRDYGPTNISASPGGAMNGLRVRMHDKLARLNNLVDTGREPSNESLRDTLLDLANYAAIGVLVLDGKWPK